MIYMAVGIKLLPSRVTTTFPCTRCSIQTLAESWKAQRSKKPSKYHARRFIAESWEESTEKPKNQAEVKPTRKDHSPEHHPSSGQEPLAPDGICSSSSAALEAESDETEVPGKKPVVGKKEGCWCYKAEAHGEKNGWSYQETSSW